MRADGQLTLEEMRARGYTEDEIKRGTLFNDINDEVESEDVERERARLSKTWPDVYDMEEFRATFIATGFAAPFVSVCKKQNGLSGYVLFQHSPRLYFGFTPEPRPTWGGAGRDGLVAIPGLPEGWR